MAAEQSIASRVADFVRECRTDPSDPFVELMRSRLAAEGHDIAAELVRESISCPAGEEPAEAPSRIIEPAYQDLFTEPATGLGALARDTLGVDEEIVSDEDITIVYQKMTGRPVDPEVRIRNAFRRSTSEFEQLYLVTVRQNWLRAETDLNRNVAYSVALFGVFELLIQAAVSRVSIFGLEIENFDLLLRLMPIALAYLFLRTTLCVWSVGALEEAYGQVMRELHPNIYMRDLETFVGVGQTNVWHAPTWFLLVSSGDRSKRLFRFGAGSLIFAATLAPLAMVVYVYWRIFDRFGMLDILSLAAVAVSLVPLIMGLAFWVAHVSEFASRAAQAGMRARG